jgi:hypothetical protein
MNYLNSFSSNSPFAIKRKVSWKCVSCFSRKNMCFMGFPFLQNMNYILRRFVQLKPRHSMRADRQTGQTWESLQPLFDNSFAKAPKIDNSVFLNYTSYINLKNTQIFVQLTKLLCKSLHNKSGVVTVSTVTPQQSWLIFPQKFLLSEWHPHWLWCPFLGNKAYTTDTYRLLPSSAQVQDNPHYLETSLWRGTFCLEDNF